jgi:S1-C subfamily serine protease
MRLGRGTQTLAAVALLAAGIGLGAAISERHGDGFRSPLLAGGSALTALPVSTQATVRDPTEAVVIRVARQAMPAVVAVGVRGGSGSGVIVRQDGIIVTNAHVTAGGESYTISTGDKLNIAVGEEVEVQGEQAREAELKGAAFCEDVAVLEVEDTAGLETMPRVPRQEDLKVGQDVVAVGYPSTLNLTQGSNQQEADLTGNTGVISTVKTTFQAIPGEGPDDPTVGPYQNVILTDTVINQGNSGGPLVNFEAKLVGMNSAVRADVQGQNYAVGIDRINEIVPRVIEGEDPC